jgi:hypothetical protein
LPYSFKNVQAKKTEAVTKLKTHGFSVSANMGELTVRLAHWQRCIPMAKNTSCASATNVG